MRVLSVLALILCTCQTFHGSPSYAPTPHMVPPVGERLGGNRACQHNPTHLLTFASTHFVNSIWKTDVRRSSQYLRCSIQNSQRRQTSRNRRVGGAVPFLPKQNHPTTYTDDPMFACFKACNSLEIADRVGVSERKRMGKTVIEVFDELGDRSAGATLARELARDGAIDSKEFFEAFEFYERVRKRVRQPLMVDLACGHGFCGLLFASLERTVERVILVDRRQPRSFHAIFAAVERVAPWIRDKVSYVEQDLEALPRSHSEWLALSLRLPCGAPPQRQPAASSPHRAAPGGGGGGGEGGLSMLALHACGLATDACVDLAASSGAALAAMPCCYSGCAADVPYGVRRALGKALAADVERSFRLQSAGFHVDWSAIPRAITPMNRILLATPRPPPSASSPPSSPAV